jgi:hypothetical protein
MWHLEVCELITYPNMFLLVLAVSLGGSADGGTNAKMFEYSVSLYIVIEQRNY